MDLMSNEYLVILPYLNKKNGPDQGTGEDNINC